MIFLKKNLVTIVLCLIASLAFVYNCSTPASDDDGDDTTAPTYISSTPATTGDTLPANSNITITFSEDIKIGTENLTLGVTGTQPNEISITDTAQVKIMGKVLTINPTNNLSQDFFTLTVPRGAILDLAGNKISQDIVIRFIASAAV